jgi:hypothetical protein
MTEPDQLGLDFGGVVVKNSPSGFGDDFPPTSVAVPVSPPPPPEEASADRVVPAIVPAPVSAPVSTRPVDELAVAVHPEITDDIVAEAKLFEVTSDPTLMEISSLDAYIVPPFSVLDTRQGYWQDRRRKWLSHGIQSEIGRDGKLTYGRFDQSYLASSTQDKYGAGSTSVFDPVLTELMFHWYCPRGGTVLDPFAGGSVRGIVAASRGLQYIGVELRGEQVAANIQQGEDILGSQKLSRPVPMPLWIQGDSDKVLDEDVGPVDLVFSCPPYADLELYSREPGDLSNMPDDEFDDAYCRILGKATRFLQPNRFAVVVISKIRNKKGHLRDLVALTDRGMVAAGLAPYNDAVLLNVAGTAPIRAGRQFQQSRKLVKVHQHVVTYISGDPQLAATDIERVV